MLGAFLCMEGALCWRRWELQQTRWERPLIPGLHQVTHWGWGRVAGGCCLAGPPL